MEESRIFRAINRLNSVLFLLLLFAAIGFVGSITLGSSSWRDRRAVEVAQSADEDTTESSRLVLGQVERVNGHDVSYVELRSRSRGGKLSGYSGGETRNVLFFVGKELTPHWLFDKNTNLLLSTKPIRKGRRYDSEAKVEVFFFQAVFNDTNGDGRLTDDDVGVFAVSMPDGSKFTILEENISGVLDYQLSEDGKSILVLYQQGLKVIYGRYSIPEMKRVSSSIVTGISKKP